MITSLLVTLWFIFGFVGFILTERETGDITICNILFGLIVSIFGLFVMIPLLITIMNGPYVNMNKVIFKKRGTQNRRKCS